MQTLSEKKINEMRITREYFLPKEKKEKLKLRLRTMLSKRSERRSGSWTSDKFGEREINEQNGEKRNQVTGGVLAVIGER